MCNAACASYGLSTNATLFFSYHVRTMFTIKGSYRRAEKSCEVLMMMNAAKLGWAGAGAWKKQGWTKSRAGPRAGPGRAEAGEGRSRAEVGTGQE